MAPHREAAVHLAEAEAGVPRHQIEGREAERVSGQNMKRGITGSAGLALIAGLLALFAGLPAASADDTEDMPDVTERYDGTGAHIGSFWFLPKLETGLFYDSNVYARSTNTKGSAGTYVAPYLGIESDWGRYGLNAKLDASQHIYFDDVSLNRTNLKTEIDGRYEIMNDLSWLGGIKGRMLDDPIGTINSNALAAEPTHHDEFEAWTTLNKSFNRISVSAGGGYHYYNYDDVASIVGGKIDQDFRDGDVLETGGRVSYLTSPELRIFADARYNWRDYRGTGADSNGWRGLAGLELELSRLIRGEAGVGYMEQYYDSGFNAGGLTYHAALIWNPSPLMTVKLDADRTIADSAIAASPGSVTDSVKLTADYEVRRGLVLSPTAEVSRVDYIGSSLDGLTYDLGVKLDYTMNRFLSFGLNYDYTNSDLNGSALDFERHVIGAYAKARF